MNTVATDGPSLCHLYFARIDATPLEIAYLEQHGDGWRPVSWSAVHDTVRRLSAGLRTLGVEAGAVISETRVAWLLADFALWTARLCTTTVYPSSTPDTTRYILEDAGVGVAFVEDLEQLEKLLGDWPRGLAHVVLIDGDHDDPRVLSWEGLQARGDTWLARHGEAFWREEALEAEATDLATLIYTSGTTGPPKGVELTHRNWLAQAAATDALVGAFAEPGDTLYLWLPLAHAYGKILQLVGLATGITTVVHWDNKAIPTVLAQTAPSWVPAVPRVFEKMQNRIVQQARDRGEGPARVARWALDVATDVGRLRSEGARIPLPLRLKLAVADRLVHRKVRAAMGGRIRAFLCGSAPLSIELEYLFSGLGMPILQGYGLTECAAVATANLPNARVPGTVGIAQGGIEIRVVDGEIQLRGPTVMRGYRNRPDANDAAFDGDWFRTGDLGSYDDGQLRITGRAKEILITAGGKNIAPAPIESAVKSRCALLQEVVLVGEGRPTCMALVTLDEDAGVRPDDPAVRETIELAIDAANDGLASYETIKGFAILPQPFSVESGELTPSQKVRRNVVLERYADIVDGLYR